MGVSAIEILQSSPSSSESKKAEERQEPNGLFAMLLQSSMQRVAYAGLINEFNLALALHDQATGPQTESAPAPEQSLESTQEAPAAPADHSDGNHADATHDARPLPVTGKVDGDAAAPGSADANRQTPAQTNGAAADAAPKQQSLGDAAKLAAQAGSLPAQARTGGAGSTGAHGSIAATVTQASAETVAQPAGSLAASAAATVQAAQDPRSTNQAAAKPAAESKPTDTLIVQGTLSRAPGKVQAAAHQGQSQPTTPAKGENQSPDTTGNQNGAATAALIAPRTLIAASTAQSEQPAGQTARSFGETLFGHAGSIGSGPTQRGAELHAPPKLARPALPPRLVAEQIAVNIQKAVGQGIDRIQIQLKPAELGRVDVHIEVGKDGHVGVHIAADRQDTLDLLQRDARALQQALQDAGLKADANSLSFNLRGDGGDFQRQLAGHSPTGADDALADIDAPTLAGNDAPRRSRIDSGHVDVEV